MAAPVVYKGTFSASHKDMAGVNLHPPFYAQASDPGAVGANIGWFNTSTNILKVRDSSNSSWVEVGVSSVPTHTHAAADIVSGVIATARLGSGTADGTTYLRGDQTWVAVPSATVIVQEGDVTVDAAAATLDFDASDFNVTSSPAGEANIALAYGTSAGTPAEGNHTHSYISGISVQEGDVTVGSVGGTTVLDFASADFNLTESPTGEVNVSLAVGGSASLAVQEAGVTVEPSAANLNFDGTDFNVSSSPSGTANVSLAYGTSANTPAEGNHTHSYQPLDATLTSLASYNTNGLIAQTAADTFAGRTITGTASEITVTNGNGVSGNPTLSLPTGISAAKIGGGLVSSAEFDFLNGVTSSIQTQIDGKAATSHVHAAADITSGTIATARLGSGTADSTVFLRGDQTWTVVSGASSTIVVQEGDVTVDAAATTLDFNSTSFDVTSSPAGEANISLAEPYAYTVTYGPFFINDLPGTATTQASLAFFNTATALSRTVNDIRASRTGEVVGLIMVSDASRTAGSAIAKVRLAGVTTTFSADACTLAAGTDNEQWTTLVAPGSGVAISSGSSLLGINVTTSGWTPTTANLTLWMIVRYNTF